MHNEKMTEGAYNDFSVMDETIFTCFYNEWHPQMMNFTIGFIKDIPLAEDIVIEAFFKVWERRHNFKSRGELKTYLYRAIRNKCFDLLKLERRKQNRLKRLGPLQSYEATTLVVNESFNPIDVARKYLPPECNKVFRMIFQDNMNCHEIADRLNLSVNSVKTQRQRAMRKLRHSPLFSLLVERAEGS